MARVERLARRIKLRERARQAKVLASEVERLKVQLRLVLLELEKYRPRKDTSLVQAPSLADVAKVQETKL